MTEHGWSRQRANCGGPKGGPNFMPAPKGLIYILFFKEMVPEEDFKVKDKYLIYLSKINVED
jgi:hypothetical protein